MSLEPTMQKQEDAAQLTGLQIKDTKPEEEKAVISTTGSEEALPVKTDALQKDNIASQDKVNKAAQSYLNETVRNNLVNCTSQLELLKQDPTSPLYSVKSFEELNLKPQLLQGVYAMGFNRPSKIQETALPMMLTHPPQNLIAQSQSGTGKTAAFVLAMLSHVEPDQHYPQSICLSPSYELALQTGKVIEEMGKYYPEVKLSYAVKGNRLARGTVLREQVVIGTPGTMLDWCHKFKFFDPKKIKVFVLDEADIMIAIQGHQDQSIRLQRMLPQGCQMLLFSATYDDGVRAFAQRIVPDAKLIQLKREEVMLNGVKQYYVQSKSDHDKLESISNIYAAITIAQAMIFCHTKKTGTWLKGALKDEGHQAELLHGDMLPEERARVIERFREGKDKVLVTTNLLARGIDVEQVSVVINFDLPVDKYGEPDYETYLHRIGRTGRFGKRGLAINMVVPGSKDMDVLKRIKDHFNCDIEKMGTDDLDEIERITGKGI